MLLDVAQIIPDTEAEGPGRRFGLWVQGCPLRCPGCCNPEMLKFNTGTPTDVRSLVARALSTPGIEGVSLLGGEPFAHACALAEFARGVRGGGLSVMIYSGFTMQQIRKMAHEDRCARELLSQTDLLASGPYERDKPDTRRRWIGSTNQEMHFLTNRYSRRNPIFTSPNTVEIRFVNGELVVNGWPDLAAAMRPRRWRRSGEPERDPPGVDSLAFAAAQSELDRIEPLPRHEFRIAATGDVLSAARRGSIAPHEADGLLDRIQGV